jgi:hypothetical protein
MHSSVWTALLRHLPPEQHDRLMLVTAGGTEIALQAVLRVEAEFIAVKGRLAGSQEAGRVFFIPYSKIDYLGFQKPLRESEFQELFGGLRLPERGQPAAAEPAAAEPAPPAAEPAPAAPAAPSSAARTPIKSAVLERFRARAAPSSSPSLPNPNPNPNPNGQ